MLASHLTYGALHQQSRGDSLCDATFRITCEVLSSLPDDKQAAVEGQRCWSAQTGTPGIDPLWDSVLRIQ